MGTVSDVFRTTFRDYITEGVPATGKHEPAKADIRAIGATIERLFGLTLGTVTTVKTTKALLDGDLAHAANSTAIVYADATDANNDLYIKSGGSGSGSWTNTGAIHAIIDGLASPYVDDAEDARDAALAGLAGGNVGDFHVKSTDADGSGFAWVGRDAFGDQPEVDTDFGVSGQYQLLGTFSSPATRFTSAVVGGELEITAVQAATFPVGAAVISQLEVGKVYRVLGRIAVPGIAGNAGVYLGFSPTAPTLGGPTVIHPAGAKLITLRTNGAVVLYDETTTAGTTLLGASEYTTEQVELILEATSTTAGNLTVLIDGVPQGTVAVTGLPSGGYFVAGIRLAGTGSKGVVTAATTYGRSPDVAKRVHIHPDVGAVGGTGTEGNPFQTLEEATASFERDTYRRELDVVLKGGVIRGSLRFDASRWRRIAIRAAMGQRPIIKASEQVTGAVWTQIGSSEVWRAPAPFYRDNNNTYGGLIDVTSGVSETFGRTGSYTVAGQRLISRLPANTADTDPAFVRGSMARHFSGTYAGQMLARMWDGGDPNTRTFEFAAYDSAISVVSSDPADAWNGCLVDLSGIETFYSFLYNVRLENVRFRLSNMHAGGAVIGYGFELNHSAGEAYASLAEGVGADGWHWSGNDAVPERQLISTLFDCWTKGAANLPQGFGDGFSNHRSSEHGLRMHGCGAIACGKDGIASSGAADLFDFYAADCSDSGVKLYADPDIANAELRMFGGVVKGNLRGVTCDTGSNPGIIRRLTARGVLADTNSANNFLSFASGLGSTAVLDAIDCRTLGSAPSGGHRSGAGVTVYTSAALA